MFQKFVSRPGDGGCVRKRRATGKVLESLQVVQGGKMLLSSEGNAWLAFQLTGRQF